jgi:hypothetical protein
LLGSITLRCDGLVEADSFASADFRDIFRAIPNPGGRLSPEALKEIIEIGREALRIKEPLAAKRIFDFSLAAEAMK